MSNSKEKMLKDVGYNPQKKEINQREIPLEDKKIISERSIETKAEQLRKDKIKSRTIAGKW